MINTFYIFAKYYLTIGVIYSTIMLHGLIQIINSDEEEDDKEMKLEIKESVELFGYNFFFISFFIITTFTWIKVLIWTILEMTKPKD